MLCINADITFELERPYIVTRVSGETARIVVHGSRRTPSGKLFDVEVNGVQKVCRNLNEIAGNFSLIAKE